MSKRVPTIATAAIALLVGWIIAPSGEPREDRDPDALRLVTANILFTNPDADEATNTLLELDFDLALVLEWTGRNLAVADVKRAGYDILVDGRRQGTSGACLLVRDGIRVEASVVPSPVPGHCTMDVITARVNWRSRWFSLVGVHAPPPIEMCGSKSEQFLDTLKRMIRDGPLIENLGSARAGDPLVMLGDLNAHPFSHHVREFRGVGLFSARAAGSLKPLLTWRPPPSLPPVVQLDYIFRSDELRSLDARAQDLPGSDHRLVVSDLSWRASDSG